jgi:mRNA interferase RelE/StbE
MYILLFSKEAKKKFYALGKGEQKQISSVLERCRIRPEHFAKRLVGSPYYRIRAGEYRIIIDIRHDEIILLMMEIMHRKKAYKILPG